MIENIAATMIGSVERILREKVMENAHTVGTTNQMFLANVPMVWMTASHWQEAAQRLKETIGEMYIKEIWLEEKLERMRKEFEEREVVKNKDKERVRKCD
jgi:hypothetical protein